VKKENSQSLYRTSTKQSHFSHIGFFDKNIWRNQKLCNCQASSQKISNANSNSNSNSNRPSNIFTLVANT